MIDQILSYVGSVILLLALYYTRTNLKRAYILNIIGGILMSIWSALAGYPAVIILNVAFLIVALYNLWKIRKG